MSSIPERQAPIDRAIVNAMIESTPETWQEIVLTLERMEYSTEVSSIGNFSHELTSPEGYPPVCPTDSLFEATYRLDELLQSSGNHRLSKAIYSAKAVGDNWSFHADYEYN
jgi:hypothetical protein